MITPDVQHSTAFVLANHRILPQSLADRGLVASLTAGRRWSSTSPILGGSVATTHNRAYHPISTSLAPIKAETVFFP